MRKLLNLTICLLLLLSCNKKEETPIVSIIPMPNKIITNSGVYKLEGKKRIYYQQDESILKVHAYFEEILKRAHVTLEYTSKENDADIAFITDNEMADEAYLLNVEQDKITIRANSSASGFFYGVQSLIQLMPPQLYDNNAKLTSVSIPKVTIEDSPRFSHRGAMMDVGRNFLPKETVLKFIDAMATYKLNVFHFHLTEDQGWRIEIKKYPRLTEVGSYRAQTQVGHSDYYFPRRYDGKEQQGYYTQEEIKEIVQYAADRFITVIPEIEMPGHASAALASYPEYSCGLGKQYVVRDYFDVFDEVYCPKEITFQFLEDVLTEVMELFPSKYIHIGGDECPKKAWKKCSHCQALMRKNNLKNEEELQSWFIQRIEKFLNSKGRDMIGWDEILEGGLAPNATVMSWRGEAGGIEAAKQQKKVIMTPGETCYFDYYQESPEYAPIAMGGYLLIDKVYNYNPLPEQLTSEEQAYIIGTQANVWGEYIQTPEHFDYMAFPRLLAMSEVQWTQLENKDFTQFAKRLDREFVRLDLREINACRSFYDANYLGYYNKETNGYEVALSSFCPDVTIHYSINDSVVNSSSKKYTTPLLLEGDATVYACTYKDGKQVGRITKKNFTVNKATGMSYTMTPQPVEENLNVGWGLTDGVMGYTPNVRRWVSFEGDTIQITIDFGKETTLSTVSLATIWRPYDKLWPAEKVGVFVSTDSTNFTSVSKQVPEYDFTKTEATIYPITLSFDSVTARYMKLEVVCRSSCPKGYYNEGKPCDVAIDEIIVH